MSEDEKTDDQVNHPSHYTYGDVEVIDIIAQAVPCFESVCMANVIKYALRYSRKNGVEDLKKAKVYLDWAINTLDNK
jgi:hypothetical protein